MVPLSRVTRGGWRRGPYPLQKRTVPELCGSGRELTAPGHTAGILPFYPLGVQSAL